MDVTHSNKDKDKWSDYDMFVMQKKRSRTSHIHRVKYPTLRAIARDFLAIHVSTIAFESAFNTSYRIVSSHHSRLHPKTLEALMCAQSQLWVAKNKGKSSQISNGYATIYDDIDSDGEGRSGGWGRIFEVWDKDGVIRIELVPLPFLQKALIICIPCVN
ncbi:hypothetical protein PTKIN_Ptkin14bG0073900 [Pterospermum kingtungense]